MTDTTFVLLIIALAFVMIIISKVLTEIDNEWYCDIVEIDNHSMIVKTKCIIDSKRHMVDVPLSRPLPSILIGEGVVVNKDETLCSVFNFDVGNVTRMIDLEVKAIQMENKYSYDVFMHYYCTLLMNINLRITFSHLRHDPRYLKGNRAEMKLILLASYGVEKIVEMYRTP